MNEKIEELVKEIYEKAEELGINLHDYYIHNPEDLILFSLKWTADSIEEAFDWS